MEEAFCSQPFLGNFEKLTLLFIKYKYIFLKLIIIGGSKIVDNSVFFEAIRFLISLYGHASHCG